MSNVKVTPQAFTVDGASDYSGLSRSRLYFLMRSGELASAMVAGRRLIPRDALDHLIHQNMERPYDRSR